MRWRAIIIPAMVGMHPPMQWIDHASNPLIDPPWPEFLIADPTFAAPPNTPDGRWHLFAHGIIMGIHHFVSDDGVRFRRAGRVIQGMRPFLWHEEGRWFLYFERLSSPWRSTINVVTSTDLLHWSRPTRMLTPSLLWEGHVFRTNGNPSLVKWRGRYRLYFSAGLSWLRDCGFPEPRHIGFAEAERPEGPFVKHSAPVLSPDPTVPHRNLGAGAIKVIESPDGGLWGFTNGIYTDTDGRSRSDIRLMTSPDGVTWTYVSDRPLVTFQGDGWKRAMVYALDVRRVGDAWVMFYNARDGWRRGRERIGRADCVMPNSGR